MSHDLNFNSGTGEVIPWYLKVNGCEQSLTLLVPDENDYYDFYNRSLTCRITKDQLVNFINSVKEVDWKGRVIPDWIMVQLNGLTELAEKFDFDQHGLYVETL